MKCIFKLKKDYVVPDKDYIKIPNSMLKLGVLGLNPYDIILLQFLMSNKDGFCINKTFIRNGLAWDKNTINRVLKKLIKFGYITFDGDELIIKLTGEDFTGENFTGEDSTIKEVKSSPPIGEDFTPNRCETHPLIGENFTTNNTIQDYKQNEETKLINKTENFSEFFSPSLAFIKVTHPKVNLIWNQFIQKYPKLNNSKIGDRFNKVLFFTIFVVEECENRNDVNSKLMKFSEENIKQYSNLLYSIFKQVKNDENQLNKYNTIIGNHFKEYKPM